MMRAKKINPLAFMLLFCGLTACYEYTPTPRPFAFPRLELPRQVGYRLLDTASCPLQFAYPNFGHVSRSLSDSCWADIFFPVFNCKWHITYRSASETGKPRGQHFEEYRSLVYKHAQKATEIKETPIRTNAGSGILFEIYGNVGTPAQVFLSDTTGERMLMMSFYYMTAEKNDSLAPATAFMKRQMMHAAESLSWR